MEDGQTLSTQVLSEKEAAEAVSREKHNRSHKNRVMLGFLSDGQRYAAGTLIVGAGVAVAVGSLYGYYYRANPAERIRLLRSQPQLAQILSKVSILPQESAQEVPLFHVHLTPAVRQLRLPLVLCPLGSSDSLRPLAPNRLDVGAAAIAERSSLAPLMGRSGSISPRCASTPRFPSRRWLRSSTRCAHSPTPMRSTSSSRRQAGLTRRANAATTSVPSQRPSRRRSTTFTSSPRRRTARTAGCTAPTCCPSSNTSSRTTTETCSDPVCEGRRCSIRSACIVWAFEKNDC